MSFNQSATIRRISRSEIWVLSKPGVSTKTIWRFCCVLKQRTIWTCWVHDSKSWPTSHSSIPATLLINYGIGLVNDIKRIKVQETDCTFTRSGRAHDTAVFRVLDTNFECRINIRDNDVWLTVSGEVNDTGILYKTGNIDCCISLRMGHRSKAWRVG